MAKQQKITLIGAGSLQFGLGTVGSILEKSDILEGSTICLHDISQKNLSLVSKACQSAIDERNLNFTLESTTDRKEALKNTTFIISSIEVTPRFELWEQDFKIPGIYFKQIFGENGGPGGLFHSLRIIPPVIEICEDVMKICPNALFINFSNPMSRICLAIKRKCPDLNFVGLCHEIGFAREHLPKMLNTPLSDLEIKAGGLNHFGVILEVNDRKSGEDLYPKLRRVADDYLQKISQLGGLNLTRYILKTYNYLPYTQDSHYGEYLQWAWDISDMNEVNNFKNVYFQFINSQGKRIRRLIEKGKGSRLVKPDNESAVPIIEAIITNEKLEELSVNLPNDGVITNLPEDLVVECPAIVDKKGLHAVKLGEYPKGLAALLRNQASVQDLTVEAALTGSKDIALQALLADPIVDSVDQAEKLLEEMLITQKKYLHLK
ncbi:MAG: family 4 glycosyl hydrolase [Promethearchaeota archaeon]